MARRIDQIQKLIRRRLADRKDLKMNQILAEFRDLKRLTSLSGQSSKGSIVEIRDKGGHKQSDRKEIAEVFACFYEDLFKTQSGKGSEQRSVDMSSIPPFSRLELQKALKTMKAGRSCDVSGLAAEMLKVDCEML